jgi:hypothetical protein
MPTVMKLGDRVPVPAGRLVLLRVDGRKLAHIQKPGCLDPRRLARALLAVGVGHLTQ